MACERELRFRRDVSMVGEVNYVPYSVESVGERIFALRRARVLSVTLPVRFALLPCALGGGGAHEATVRRCRLPAMNA